MLNVTANRNEELKMRAVNKHFDNSCIVTV